MFCKDSFSLIGKGYLTIFSLHFLDLELLANCLKREDRTGKVHFYHSAITPVIVKPGKAQVLPLPPEFIVPQDGSEKQDCERMAAKR
jgi:hypothetical protein